MEATKPILYILAFLTSGACAVLLYRAFLARKHRLLMWSAISFGALTVNNLLLFTDLVVFPGLDLRIFRLAAALVGMFFLLYGFIWDTE
jgi:hypothetical protein